MRLLHPDAPFFKEFALQTAHGRPRRCATRSWTAATWPASRFPQAGDDVLLVAVTERRTRAEIDGLAEAMGEVLQA